VPPCSLTRDSSLVIRSSSPEYLETAIMSETIARVALSCTDSDSALRASLHVLTAAQLTRLAITPTA
jgi:hypothetical protein